MAPALALGLGLLLSLSTASTASTTHLRDLLSLPGARRLNHESCSVTPGVDFPGNDLSSVANRPASACCDECQRLPECRAWSWSLWNGGTCWLKSAKGTAAANPAVQSAELGTTPPSCPMTRNVDYIGHDLASVRAAPADACCGICAAWSGCKAFSWTALHGGTCWLKSAKGATRSDPNVQSGDAAGPPACTLQHGVDLYDNDIGRVAGVAAPGGCCGVCQNWSGCRAFSWTALDGGTCWLKSRAGAVRNTPGVVSSAVLPNLPPSCALMQHDTDYVDHDIASVKNGDAVNCCDVCRAWGGGGVCAAFSWSNYEGGTCWLKSAKGATITKPGVISGTV